MVKRIDLSGSKQKIIATTSHIVAPVATFCLFQFGVKVGAILLSCCVPRGGCTSATGVCRKGTLTCFDNKNPTCVPEGGLTVSCPSGQILQCSN